MTAYSPDPFCFFSSQCWELHEEWSPQWLLRILTQIGWLFNVAFFNPSTTISLWSKTLLGLWYKCMEVYNLHFSIFFLSLCWWNCLNCLCLVLMLWFTFFFPFLVFFKKKIMGLMSVFGFCFDVPGVGSFKFCYDFWQISSVFVWIMVLFFILFFIGYFFPFNIFVGKHSTWGSFSDSEVWFRWTHNKICSGEAGHLWPQQTWGEEGLSLQFFPFSFSFFTLQCGKMLWISRCETYHFLYYLMGKCKVQPFWSERKRKIERKKSEKKGETWERERATLVARSLLTLAWAFTSSLSVLIFTTHDVVSISTMILIQCDYVNNLMSHVICLGFWCRLSWEEVELKCSLMRLVKLPGICSNLFIGCN